MNTRDFACYVMVQLEKRYHDGETKEMIVSWLNGLIKYNNKDYERYGDLTYLDDANMLRSMRDAYMNDGLDGCRKYLNET